MEVMFADVSGLVFDAEEALRLQLGALVLPFQGMDKSTAAVCEYYGSPAGCREGGECPFRHVRGDRSVVCKHWLRGLCKKGDHCEFLHEYDMTKMPECYFYSRFNACHNKECPFLHIDPETKIRDCPWYDRGFCRHGPHCRHRHVRRVLCANYAAGLCPEGPDCKFVHPRFELPAPPEPSKDAKRQPVCHFCGELGHKVVHCHRLPQEQREAAQRGEDARNGSFSQDRGHGDEDAFRAAPGGRPPMKPIEEITCFKCGTKGHYANKCPKGHLAFLSQAQNPPPLGGHRR